MLNHLNELSNNNISNYYVVNNAMFQTQRRLGSKGSYQEEELLSIIVDQKGESDCLAISLYTYIRAWFKPKKNGDLKLKEKGYKTSYEELAKKFKCSKYKIKRRIVALENLGLIARDFRIEYMCGQRLNNVLYILVWKETPHFYNEFGIEKTVAFPANLDKKTWENIHKKDSDIFIANADTPPIKTTQGLGQECTTPRANLHTLYNSNTTLNTTLNTNFGILDNFGNLDISRKEEDIHCLEKENISSDTDNFYNQFRLSEEKQAPKPYVWDYELYRKERAHLFTDSDSTAETKTTKIACEDKQEEDLHIPEFLAKESDIELPTSIVSKGLDMLQSIKITKNVEAVPIASDTKEQRPIQQAQTKPITSTSNHGNTHSSATKPKFEPKLGFQPKLLRDYRFNKQSFDEIRILTGDFELTDDEMIGTIRRIVTDKPDTQIWGGRRAFTNFMVKVMNNQRKAELDEDDDSESIAEMERKRYEKALYNYENRIIEWF